MHRDLNGNIYYLWGDSVLAEMTTFTFCLGWIQGYIVIHENFSVGSVDEIVGSMCSRGNAIIISNIFNVSSCCLYAAYLVTCFCSSSEFGI